MSSRYIEATFHSGTLLPESAVLEIRREKDLQDQQEKAMLWIESRSQTHFLRSGDRVFHIGNLEQLMFVSRVVRKKYGDDKEKRTKIVGIEVYFWEKVPEVKYV